MRSVKKQIKWLLGKYYDMRYRRNMFKGGELKGKYGSLRFVKEFSIDETKRIIKYNNEKNLGRIKKKARIHIGFLVYTSSMWNVEELYRLIDADEHFEADIIIGHFGMNNTEATNEEYDITLKHFKEKDYTVKESSDIIDINNYDIIFSLTPARMTDDMDFYKFPLNIMLLHTSYSYMLAGNMEKLDYDMYHWAWRYYTDSEYYKGLIEGNKLYTGSAKYLGFPKMDAFYSANILRKSDKKTIIYAPHHSVNYKEFKSATFEYNYQRMLELAKKYSDTTYWIYKPHPLLRAHSIEAGIFETVEGYDKYEKEWNELTNGEVINSGDYFPIFKGSDAMITDSVSFLAEYQFTQNPLLLLESGEEKYNEFGNSIKDILYSCPGEDFDSIESFIRNVIDGTDERKEARQEYFIRNLKYINNGKNANELIYEDILQFTDLK